MFEPIDKNLGSKNEQTIGSKCPETILSPPILFHSLHNDNKQERKKMESFPDIRARYLKREKVMKNTKCKI